MRLSRQVGAYIEGLVRSDKVAMPASPCACWAGKSAFWLGPLATKATRP